MASKSTPPASKTGPETPSGESLFQAIGKRLKRRMPILIAAIGTIAVVAIGVNLYRHRPMTAERYYWQGVDHLKAGSTAYAMLDWQNSVRLDSKNPRPYLAMSEVEERSGNLGRAADLLGTVLYYHPKHPHLQCRRAQLYGMANRFEMAFTVAQDGVAIEPNCAAAFNAYGMLLEKAGDYAGAAAALGRAHTLLPTDHALSLDYARILALSGKPQDALGIVEAELATNKFPVQAHYLEGWILSEYGRDGKLDLKNAVIHFGLALVENSEHTQTLTQLGRIYLRTNNLSGAQTELEHAFKNGPASLELVDALVELYDRLNSPLLIQAKQTNEQLKAAMIPLRNLRHRYVQNPNDLDNNMKLADAELGVGNTFDAFDLVRMVHEKDPTRKDAADKFTEMRTGKPAAAPAPDKQG
jgi:tetratricopeptide (TPR) repeat protein